MTKYVPAAGARLSEEQAQRYGNFLEGIADKNGSIQATDLIEFRNSPELSDYFILDKNEAAWKYWEVQAYYLLRSIHVEIRLPDGQITTTRAFYPIQVNVITEKTTSEPKEYKIKVYKKAEDVLSDEEMRLQVLEQALEEFRYMRNKYQNLKELASIFEAIDAL